MLPAGWRIRPRLLEVCDLAKRLVGGQVNPAGACGGSRHRSGSKRSADRVLRSAAFPNVTFKSRGPEGGVVPRYACSCVSGEFQSQIPYQVLDNFGDEMLASVTVNESWTTGVTEDNPKANWTPGKTGYYNTPNGQFADIIARSGSEWYPTPLCPQNPLSGTKEAHWGQEWWVGSATSGSGAPVQTDVLQEYLDHALHLSILSPP